MMAPKKQRADSERVEKFNFLERLLITDMDKGQDIVFEKEKGRGWIEQVIVPLIYLSLRSDEKGNSMKF